MSFMPFLNSEIPLPSERMTSGRRFPKIRSAMMRITSPSKPARLFQKASMSLSATGECRPEATSRQRRGCVITRSARASAASRGLLAAAEEAVLVLRVRDEEPRHLDRRRVHEAVLDLLVRQVVRAHVLHAVLLREGGR